ncbi:MlaD family protein [Rufibacter sp. LB8]|uniref:MlaD family protein n=1 Tax=Rufibacter sp. LB8 TaxID=2777781 RepID=UPI00178C3758|nr:MlaD family protein [Rufibacter sp. LB8]
MSAVENRRAVIVGVFVLLAVLILVAGIFILGGQQKRFAETIQVTAQFTDVTGLKKGNHVLFSGVRVGVVESITITDPSKVSIAISIEESAKRFIHKDVMAKIGAESLIGNKAIVLYGGTDTAPGIENGDVLRTETPLSMDDMMATFQKSNDNLQAITTDVKGLTASLAKGEGMAGALLTDAALAENFRRIVANLERTSATSVRASQALTQFSNKLNTQGGLADELLTDTVTFNKLKGTMTELQKTMAAAADLTAKLSRTTDKLGSNDNALGVLLNDEQFALDLQLTMQNLEAGTDKLDANMETLQHSILLNGFFRRKAKREAREKEREADRQERRRLLEEKEAQKKANPSKPLIPKAKEPAPKKQEEE